MGAFVYRSLLSSTLVTLWLCWVLSLGLSGCSGGPLLTIRNQCADPMEWRLLSTKYPDSSYLTFEYLYPGSSTTTRLNRSYSDYVILVRRSPDGANGSQSVALSLQLTGSVVVLKDGDCL